MQYSIPKSKRFAHLNTEYNIYNADPYAVHSINYLTLKRREQLL